jgi:VWFA-related protein
MMKACVAFALASMPVLFAQTLPPAASESPVIGARSTLVLIPALVRTGSGQLVYTLTANDFEVTDDGVEQRVALEEETGGQPLALVIVVETGRAGALRLDSYSRLGPILDTLVGHVPHTVAVVGFDSAPSLVQDFTPDVDLVAAVMREMRPGNGEDAILDSLGFAVNLLRKQPPGYRRAILLISETLDHGSRMNLEDALRAISDTNTAIYSMGFSTTKADTTRRLGEFNSDMTPSPVGGCMTKNPKADPDANSAVGSSTDTDATRAGGNHQNRLAQAYDCLGLLAPPLWAAKLATMAAIDMLRRNVPESVAELSGGEFYKFENTGSLQHGLIAISNHIPNRYVLSFQPQSPHPGLHAIELRLRNYPNLVVTARGSYWADSETLSVP